MDQDSQNSLCYVNLSSGIIVRFYLDSQNSLCYVNLSSEIIVR